MRFDEQQNHEYSITHHPHMVVAVMGSLQDFGYFQTIFNAFANRILSLGLSQVPRKYFQFFCFDDPLQLMEYCGFSGGIDCEKKKGLRIDILLIRFNHNKKQTRVSGLEWYAKNKQFLKRLLNQSFSSGWPEHIFVYDKYEESGMLERTSLNFMMYEVFGKIGFYGLYTSRNIKDFITFFYEKMLMILNRRFNLGR